MTLIIMRIYSNQIIYGNSNGQIWSFYSVLLPSLYFSLIHTFSFSYKENIEFYEKNFPKLILLVIYTTLLTLITYKGFSEINIRLLKNKNSITEIKSLSKLNNKIPKIIDQKEYFLTDEFLMAPFMQRSHVSLDYLIMNYPPQKNGGLQNEESQNKFEEVISKASFAIFKCDSDKLKEKFLKNRGWYSEIDNKCSGDYSLMYPPK